MLLLKVSGQATAFTLTPLALLICKCHSDVIDRSKQLTYEYPECFMSLQYLGVYGACNSKHYKHVYIQQLHVNTHCMHST